MGMYTFTWILVQCPTHGKCSTNGDNWQQHYYLSNKSLLCLL